MSKEQGEAEREGLTKKPRACRTQQAASSGGVLSTGVDSKISFPLAWKTAKRFPSNSGAAKARTEPRMKRSRGTDEGSKTGIGREGVSGRDRIEGARKGKRGAEESLTGDGQSLKVGGRMSGWKTLCQRKQAESARGTEGFTPFEH